jgi:hypothetical protein
MIRYVFAEDLVPFAGSKIADPQVIGEAIASIAAGFNDELLPGAVVDAARSKASPLHPHFEWDDAVAAEKHREVQARQLIRAIRIEPQDNEDEPPRAWHSINDGGRSYRPIATIQASASLQERLLSQVDGELAAMQRRHRALAGVCEALGEARERIARKHKVTARVAVA